MRLWLPLLMLGVAWPALGQSVIDQVTPNAAQVEQYAKFEVRFRIGTLYHNPYDPDQADVAAEFTAPGGGTKRVIAFWDGQAVPTQATRDWVVRFAPGETGTYHYTLTVDDVHGRGVSQPGTFTATASNRKGFIVRDPYNRLRLRHTTGEPYTPMGHNLAWPDTYGSDEYERWLGRFAQHGLNCARIWMNPYSGQGLEWAANDPTGRYFGIGRYSPQISRHFDRLLETAEANNVALFMCVYSFNEWRIGGFSNWDHSPYNVDNGGWLTNPAHFFSDEQARMYARKLLRYVVARWGHSTSVLAWQMFNEFNMITRTDFATPGAWHSEMGDHIKSLDPYGHPYTTSLTNQLSGGLWNADFWQRPQFDIIAEHRYSSDVPASQMRLANHGLSLGKPTIITEVGMNPSGWDDHSGNALRRMAWASGLRHSATMYWWWQSLHAVNHYPRYDALVKYVQGEDWGLRGLVPADFVSTGGVANMQTYGIQSPYRVYAWAMAPDGSGEVHNFTLNNLRLEDGTYRVEFWRTTQPGGMLSTRQETVVNNQLDLTFPAFHNDLAVKLLPLTPEPTVTPIDDFNAPTPTPTATSTIVFAPGTLISQGKPAYASSIFGTGYEAWRANDGVTNQMNSRWISGGQGAHWWYVDLQGQYCLTQVDVFSEQSAGGSTALNVSGYRIRASQTGVGGVTTWDLIGVFDDPCGAPYPSYDPNQTALTGCYRFVALEITGNDGICGSHARLVEVQVYGNSPTPAATWTPTPTPSLAGSGHLTTY